MLTRTIADMQRAAYPHPSLEPCLKSTFGLVIYEEHVLQICEAFADLPPGRADVLRRALGKQKAAVINEIGAEFFACAKGRGRSEEKIQEVWALLTGFAGYAFCKAHSTAYGVEAYQAAWLKCYHPAAFMAAVLSNGKGFYHPLVYVLECHRLGLGLLPPSVNQLGPKFEASNRSIRVPLTRGQVAERRYARQRLHKVRAIQDQKSSCSSNICLRLGDSVQEFTPSFEIPHSTDANYVAGLIADFEQLVDLLIKKPLVAAVSDYLQEQARILATENRGEDSHNGSDSTWCAMPDDFPERLPDKPIKKQTDPGQ